MTIKYIKSQYCIINIKGKDSKTLLQSLITQNIDLLSSQNSIYSLLLTNTGRYYCDFWIVNTGNQNEFVIVIDKNQADKFITKLKFYKLRSEVYLDKRDEGVYIFFSNESNAFNALTSNVIYNESYIAFKDNRLDNLGFFLICKNLNIQKIEDLFKSQVIEDKDNTNYLTHLYKNTIPTADILEEEKSIPIEFGFDELSAISYNKGCYLGQEFTNSAKRTLKVRKRLITFISDGIINVDKGASVVNQSGEKVAKVVGLLHNGRTYILAISKMKEIINQPNALFLLNGETLSPNVQSWIQHYSLD